MFFEHLIFLKNACRRFFSARLMLLGLVFCGMFSVLVMRLFDLQIVHGNEYQRNYADMTERTVLVPAARGRILDCEGRVLAYNEPIYVVTVQDTGAYPGSGEMNLMLLRLVRILNSHGVKASGRLEIGLGENGDFVYTSVSEAARRRFLRDYYGLKTTDELDGPGGMNSSKLSASELLSIRSRRYDIDRMAESFEEAADITDAEKLQIIDIRYTMSLTSFKKYEAVTITSYVDDETIADILEHTDELAGVNVESSYRRVYSNSTYFAPILGYTGKIQGDQLEELRSQNSDYELNDTVGRTGIEASMEQDLQGKKGSRDIIVNNVGAVLQVTAETEPVAGNDVWLTIDSRLQIGVYNIIEKQLAAIVADKLSFYDVDKSEYTDTSKMPISVKEAYYQLIANFVLDTDHMQAEDASAAEKSIYAGFQTGRQEATDTVRTELLSESPRPGTDLSEETSAYMGCLLSMLSDRSLAVINLPASEASSETAKAYRTGTISAREYLIYCIQSGYVNTSALGLSGIYSDTDEIYGRLVDFALDRLQTDEQFTKKVFKYQIDKDRISGSSLCLALMDQGVVTEDEQARSALSGGDAWTAYSFIKDRISDLSLTPAQMALDPCTGGAVITDVNTGMVRALVTYPSYDNNRLSGIVDTEYYNQLSRDLSLPLYNNATQAKKAPGSTFKPLTAIAGVEEGVIDVYDTITCTGLYDDISPAIKCWIYPSSHGALNVAGGLQNSCNYFFAEVAHRLSQNEDGSYSAEKGLNTLKKYVSMFGLDRATGIEISEISPDVTNEDPERSAIGQGTNAYSNIQLSRYVAAIANSGTVFDLTLIDKVTDASGGLIRANEAKISGKIDIAQSTWNAVHRGMRAVVQEGSARSIFEKLEVDIAGKTGTAQESKTRANHAFFISYGPYTNPEIAVTVNIPYGYTSSNAAVVARDIYRLYFGYLDLADIMSADTSDMSDVRIAD